MASITSCLCIGKFCRNRATKNARNSIPRRAQGEGEVKWIQLFALLERVGKTQRYIAEYEVEGRPPPESVRHCLENSARWGCKHRPRRSQRHEAATGRESPEKPEISG